MKELEELLQKSNDLIGTQAPEIIEQYIEWSLVAHTFGAIVSGAIFVIAIVAVLLGFTKWADDNYDPVGFWLIGGCIALFSSMPLIINVYNIFYINIAPKAYCIEQLTR